MNSKLQQSLIGTDERLTILAGKLLEQITNTKMQRKRIDIIKTLLSTATIKHSLEFDSKLTHQEMVCLFYAAKGKTSSETATLLGIKKSTIESHRKEIKRKLDCQTMAQAVFEGVRYAYIPSKIN